MYIAFHYLVGVGLLADHGVVLVVAVVGIPGREMSQSDYKQTENRQYYRVQFLSPQFTVRPELEL